MWIIFALGSALFAGLTAILAKCGIKETDSNIATAIRTIVVLVFSWVMVFIVGSQSTISEVGGKTWIFLILSGIATGASWLCYFKALQLGDVNKVVPIDKASIILTLLLAILFLQEEISFRKWIAVICISVGTFLMIQKKEKQDRNDRANSDVKDNSEVMRKGKKGWLFYAILAAVFASLTTILGKIGIVGIESNLGTAIRTIVVLIMAWIVVFATGKQQSIRRINKKELGYICLSGLATGASWLCFYKALQDGITSVVVCIDKLSMVVIILFSYLVFREKLTKKSGLGLLVIIVGTILMLG